MGSGETVYNAARDAQPAWAARSVNERRDIIGAFRIVVEDRREELARILTDETGKPITQARNELAGVLPRIDFFLDATGRVLDTRTVLDDATQPVREQISYEPLGVIVNISAWNYPWFVGSNVFIPALLTGNAVLYKPSEFATATGRSIAAALHEAGVPVDVFVPVVGDGAVGAQLLAQPIDGVFFTGSYATGRRIAESVAGRMIPVQLELGGKDPVYVADDVDVAVAVEGLADGAFYNNGQSCCSVERIYVHRGIYDEFVDAFVKVVDGFVVGDPRDDDTYIGPLTRPQQLDMLEAQVRDAVEKGAVVCTGGSRSGGHGSAGFEPTVLTGVTHAMSVMRDESFGPIIGIQRVHDDDEAIERMNDTEYGLTAGVYSANEARARRILEHVNAGSAYWNCCDRVSPRLPWSGRGHSGIGSTLSEAGIQAFVRPKAWHLRAPTQRPSR